MMHITDILTESKDEGNALQYVKKHKGKWALVSKYSGKALKYFDKKPTEEEAAEALKNVESYKHNPSYSKGG